MMTKIDDDSLSSIDSTKHSLILAGLNLFAEYGFKATTTRMICDFSGANVSAIPYYFNNKRGLYNAVIEYICSRFEKQTGKDKKNIALKIKEQTLDRKEAFKVLKQLIKNEALFLVNSEEPQAWAQLIIREQSNPTDAFEIIYERQIKKVVGIYTKLIGLCTNLDPDSDQAKIICHTIMGQTLAFVVNRESILRSLESENFTSQQLTLIHQTLIKNVEAMLSSYTC